MPIDKDQLLAPLSKIKREDVETLYKKTVTAILTISITYLSGIILFTALLLLGSSYFYLALLIPLFGYVWIISFGSRHVNNRYGLKKTKDGVWVYIKKRHSYSTFVSVHVLIFFIMSIVRLVNEIKNLCFFRQELEKA